MQWLAQLLSRRRRYDDLAISIQEHIAERTDELMEGGMPRVEAEQAARREFGNGRLWKAFWLTCDLRCVNWSSRPPSRQLR
jgi:hypothetical protein